MLAGARDDVDDDDNIDAGNNDVDGGRGEYVALALADCSNEVSGSGKIGSSADAYVDVAVGVLVSATESRSS